MAIGEIDTQALSKGDLTSSIEARQSQRSDVIRSLAAQAIEATSRSAAAGQANRPDTANLRFVTRSAATDLVNRSDRLGGAIDRVASTLAQLRSAVRDVATQQGASADAVDGAQRQIDSLVASLDHVAAESGSLGDMLRAGGEAAISPFRVTNVSPALESLDVSHADLGGEKARNVDVVVTASAQPGSLYLSFGGGAIDLTSFGGNFTFEVAGNLGARALAFASGTSLSAMADAINYFSDVTGATAKLAATGTGLLVQTEGVGDTEQVSVRILNDGGISNVSTLTAGAVALHPFGTVGVYNVGYRDANTPSIIRRNFASAEGLAPIVDAGQDVRAIMAPDSKHGFRVLQASGATIMLSAPDLSFVATLPLGPVDGALGVSAQHVGFFRAFTIEASAPPPVHNGAGGDDPDKTQTDGSDAAHRGVNRLRFTADESGAALADTLSQDAGALASALRRAPTTALTNDSLAAGDAVVQQGQLVQLQALDAALGGAVDAGALLDDMQQTTRDLIAKSILTATQATASPLDRDRVMQLLQPGARQPGAR